jgi:hypothetical protein
MQLKNRREKNEKRRTNTIVDDNSDINQLLSAEQGY